MRFREIATVFLHTFLRASRQPWLARLRMPASAAKKVTLHPLRAEEVSDLVAEMKAEIEAAKEALKAEREAARKRKNGSTE